MFTTRTIAILIVSGSMTSSTSSDSPDTRTHKTFTTDIGISRRRTILIPTAISVPQLLFGPASKALPQSFDDEIRCHRARTRVRGCGPAANVVHACSRSGCVGMLTEREITSREASARRAQGEEVSGASDSGLRNGHPGCLLAALCLVALRLFIRETSKKALHRCSNLHRMSVERKTVGGYARVEVDDRW